MGGNTSSNYADLYMSHQLSMLGNLYETYGIRLIRKYVDDFFLYISKDKIQDFVKDYSAITGLDFTIEEANVQGELPFLDVLIIDRKGELRTRWYKKPICSDRGVNYHSNIPRSELVNTYTQRIVTSSVNDSGGGILKSYFIILLEMWNNNLPRRFMKICLCHAKRYDLGRMAENKRNWLTLLSVMIYRISLGYHITYDIFYKRLQDLYKNNEGIFNLTDDMSKETSTNNVQHSCTDKIDRSKKIYVIPYRGRNSDLYYKHLRQTYKWIRPVFSHDKYYSMRTLVQKGIKRNKKDISAKRNKNKKETVLKSIK